MEVQCSEAGVGHTQKLSGSIHVLNNSVSTNRYHCLFILAKSIVHTLYITKCDEKITQIIH